PLQMEVLAAFFQRERGFFLTGGAALAGFHLGHRATDDLDLFTLEARAFERGRFVLTEVAQELGAALQVRQDAPGFKRLVLTRGVDALVIDLVKDAGSQLHPDKLERDGVVMDPADEILANKLTALVGRAEERDLVDVMFLERAGYSVEAMLPAALAKDGGCTPATLAWLLSEIEIPDGIVLPAGVSPAELRAYVSDLISRLLTIAAPT
ncbi:MAG TPA: nucleotidyl transferase AbiEii/AbiGii toxin family protein, partial [Kofleriaceae bacterium]|nr:nucleotidyl transferase AbiEii/AbiGii toxin family protein [Kofleriaceae bacterium]